MPATTIHDTAGFTTHDDRTTLCRKLALVLLGIVALRFALLHVVVPKSDRFLVPLVPLLLILTCLALHLCLPTRKAWRYGCVAVIIATMSPGRPFVRYLHDLRFDPARQIGEIAARMNMDDCGSPIYTDLNDLAVMARTGRRAVAVVGEGSWHHSLLGRPRNARREIPDGATYLTRHPGDAEILAESSEGRGGRLYLVRWKAPTGRLIGSSQRVGECSHEWVRATTFPE
jgi:hypothetical protein